MRTKRIIASLVILALCSESAWCQEVSRCFDGLEIMGEAQYSCSNGNTPLWLNANKYGLSSLESQNGYFRAAATRSIDVDSLHNWKFGYGVDLAAAFHYTNTIVLNEAYAQVGYKKASITVGAKRRYVPMTNQELSSGAMVYGWNSRPIPQASLDIDWFSFPWTNHWWKWRVHGSYGTTTDGSWLKDQALPTEHYTGNVLYHEKALYWKFGKEDPDLFPLTLEIGLQFASVFGGTTYNFKGRGYSDYTDIEHPATFKAFIDALTCMGSDETDGTSKNTAGNHVGSWDFRLAWHDYDWSAAVRFERFFEDQSMMFIQYGVYDHLVGVDVTLPKNEFVSAVTFEHLSTYDQSGAILHDAATTIPDKMNGRDDYYNHGLYCGYQHWGQACGTPLITSTIYNKNGSVLFKNNRVRAWHAGIKGDPLNWLHWRVLATFTKNWGTYDYPLEDVQKQTSLLVEATIDPCIWKGWQVKVGFGLDHGGLLGNNTGGQLTIRRTFSFHAE